MNIKNLTKYNYREKIRHNYLFRWINIEVCKQFSYIFTYCADIKLVLLRLFLKNIITVFCLYITRYKPLLVLEMFLFLLLSVLLLVDGTRSRVTMFQQQSCYYQVFYQFLYTLTWDWKPCRRIGHSTYSMFRNSEHVCGNHAHVFVNLAHLFYNYAHVFGNHASVFGNNLHVFENHANVF